MYRIEETEVEANIRREHDTLQHQIFRAKESEEQIANRRTLNRLRNIQVRDNESEQMRRIRLSAEAENRANQCQMIRENTSLQLIQSEQSNPLYNIHPTVNQVWNRAALNYISAINYSQDRNIDIGKMSRLCRYCLAKKWKNESEDLCCSKGTVLLPILPFPFIFFQELLAGETTASKEFLSDIRK